MVNLVNSNGTDNPVSAVYDKIAASIAIAPITENGSLKIDHWHGNALLRRYRVDENGDKWLSPIPDIHVFSSNDFSATAADDPAFAAFYTGILDLIQTYVDAKGL